MKNFNRIERRLKGVMSREETEAFDREMAQNEELAREFEQQKLEEDLLDLAVEEDLLSEIRAIRQDQRQENPVVPLRPFRLGRAVLSVAAVLAVLVVSYFVLQNKGPADDPRALALESYRAFPPNFSGTKSVGADEQVLQENIQKLQSGNIDQVRSSMAYFEMESPQIPAADYYLGHGYWATGDYEKSVANFESFLEREDPGSRLVPNAEYYLALSLLASGKTDAARQYMEDKATGHPFEKQMKSLLKKME